MKIKVVRSQLLKSLEDLGRIAPPGYAWPILSCVLIKSLENMVTLTATDLKIALTCKIPAATQSEPGITAVNLEILKGIVIKFCSEEVEIYTEDGSNLSVSSGGTHITAPCLSAEEYPKLPNLSREDAIRLEQSTLKRMLTLVAFAASRDEMKYMYCGVQFHISGDMITLVATNGSTLAAIENKIPYAAGKELSFLVPNKTLDILAGCLTPEAEITLYKGENQVLFDLNSQLIHSRAVEGEIGFYEHYQSFRKLRSNPCYYIKADRLTLLNALKSASKSISALRADSLAIALKVYENKLELYKNVGETKVLLGEMSIEFSGEKEFLIGFSPGRIIPILEVLECESVEFEVSGSERPAIIRETAFYFVLPERI